jgi:hypothetical protein
MVRLIVVTFFFLAWAFWELSGGADFDPDRARLEASGSDPLKSNVPEDPRTSTVPSDEGEVTRVSLDLTSLEDVVGGRGGRISTRLPQQSAPQPEASSTGSGEFLPSLVANATPEGVLAEPANDAGTAGLFVDTADIRVVDGSRVNVRSGPGTDYGVVDTLIRGDRVEILDDSGTGWVRMRDTASGTIGWMADFLLTDR